MIGSEQHISDVFSVVCSKEYEYNIRCIFAGVVGSMATGLDFCNSDIDERVFFIHPDFPKCKLKYGFSDNVFSVKSNKRNNIIDISFWELSSSLDLLYFDGIMTDKMVDNYEYCVRTLNSPYTWDPYGLQKKIEPIIDAIIKEYVLIRYFFNFIRDNKTQYNEIMARVYLKIIYAAATIDWILTYDKNPPTNINTIVSMLNGDIRELIIDTIMEIKSVVNNYVRNHIMDDKEMYKKIHVRRKINIDRYIEATQKKAEFILYDRTKMKKASSTIITIDELFWLIYSAIKEGKKYENCDFGRKTPEYNK